MACVETHAGENRENADPVEHGSLPSSFATDPSAFGRYVSRHLHTRFAGTESLASLSKADRFELLKNRRNKDPKTA